VNRSILTTERLTAHERVGGRRAGARSASLGALLVFQDPKIRRPIVEFEPSSSIGHIHQLY
jgi:hypothetical protein